MSLPAVTKTVAVLGASYGGTRAAQLLIQGLPKGWRVVVVDRNSHMNHLYVLPRYAVVPGHEHKAFIPYGPMFRRPDLKSGASAVFLHARVTSLSPHALTLSRAFPEHGIEDPARTLNFDYAVYALGSHLPAPIDLWGSVGDEQDIASIATGVAQADLKSTPRSPSALPLADAMSTNGTKAEGIDWLKRFHRRIENASSILIVGGGALGVQYATDIADVFPGKHVTLLHSREQLLPKFSKEMHDEIISSLSSLNVTTILGDRLDLASLKAGHTVITGEGRQERVARTLGGKEIRAELVLLCTGQKPNTALMAQAIPDAVIPDGPKKGYIHVMKTMQVAVPTPSAVGKVIDSEKDGDAQLRTLHPHMFAIGDAADAFGAIHSGRSSYFQADIAAQNILKLIQHSEDAKNLDEELQRYTPDPPGIKISLGLKKQLYQMAGKVGSASTEAVDMGAQGMWELYGVHTDEAGLHA